MIADVSEENLHGQDGKKDGGALKCLHCSKPISKRRVKDHQDKCSAARIALPDGFRVQTVDGRLTYFCSCGYRGKRYLVLQHTVKCQQKQLPSSTAQYSVSELLHFQQTGQLIPLAQSEIAPVVIEPVQSISMTIQEIEFHEDSNCKNFDYQTHPKFAQFKLPKEDAPITNLENRFKIFTISLLLRFTGYFDKEQRAWQEGRFQNIDTERFLAQLNSHSSIFKGSLRNLSNLQADLQDVALVRQSSITVINHKELVHQLKEALENYKYAAIWHMAHVTPMVEKKRKRAPRAHWETRKMRKYIANVKYRNRKWGWKLRPLTTLQMRERSTYCEQADLMYMMKYHMSRPIPRNHKKENIAKKDKLMVQYAIHRIADAFTADFYVDYIRLEMKVVERDEGTGFEDGHTVNIFQSQKAYQDWKKKVSKQLPTTAIWIGVPRFYLQQRKSLMSAIYYSCQDRFRRPMPNKTDEEIYQLTINWYKQNYLIAGDDWPEMKKSFEDKEGYEQKIQKHVERVKFPRRPMRWSEMIDDKAPESPPQMEIQVHVALPKPHPREFTPKYNVFAFTQDQILQRNAKFELKNKPKDFDVMDFQRCSNMSCSSWLNGNVLDCSTCHASYHSHCWPNNDLCNICQLHNDSLGYSSCLPESVKRVLSLFPLRKRMLTPPEQILFPEGQAAAIKNVEQNLDKQQYCVYNVFHQGFILFPFYNEGLVRLDPADESIIDRYAKKELAFPVAVKQISTAKGKGLVARRPIRKGELVATYSGNVMALSQVAKYGDSNINQYTFDLIYGPDVMSNYAVYPKDYASTGFFMNHASSSTNVTTQIVLTKNGPIIMMIASKEIIYGKELVYNYNGCVKMYNTDDFV